MKKTKFLIYFITVLICLYLPVKGLAYVIRLDHITIKSADQDSKIAEFIAQIISGHQERLHVFFNHRLKKPVTIVLAAETSQNEQIRDLHLPEWSNAVAIPDRRLIILKHESHFDPEAYKTTILHELAHIYLADKLQQNKIPLWLNEGIAMYLSGKTLSWQENITAGNAVLSRNLLSFDEIDRLIRFKRGKAQIAYIQSYLAVQYFFENYGERELRSLLDDLAQGKSISEFLQSELGLGYLDLEYYTLKYIRDEFWWMVFLQIDTLLWVLMPVLAIMALIVIQIRNRRRIREWNIEDSLDEEG